MEEMKKIDWEGFFSKLNEQERDAIIVITLNKIMDWITKHEKIIRETGQLAENLAIEMIEQKREIQKHQKNFGIIIKRIF